MLLNSLKLPLYLAHPEDSVVLLLDKSVELGEVEDQHHAAQDGEHATHNLHSCAHKVILCSFDLYYVPIRFMPKNVPRCALDNLGVKKVLAPSKYPLK